MQDLKFARVAMAAALVAAAGCGNAPGTVERKSQSTTETAQGQTERKQESKQVADTLEAKTETKSDTPEGTVKTKTETYVGTVAAYTPGKKIEITTGENKKHTFDLDEKNLMAIVDSGVKVGSRVKLVEEKGDNTSRRITVSPQG